jgi:hypothetical protein
MPTTARRARLRRSAGRRVRHRRYFALLDAMKAFRPELPAFFTAPMTPERVLMALYGGASRDSEPVNEAKAAVSAE